MSSGDNNLSREFIMLLGANDLLESSLVNISQNGSVFDEDIFEDLVLDSNEVLHHMNGDDLYYPVGEMDSASVVCLLDSNDLADDQLIQRLMQAARKTRLEGSRQPKLRLRLINFDDSSDTVEFSSELEYWGLIAAIKKALDHNVGSVHTGRCTLINSGGEVVTASRGVSGFLFGSGNNDVNFQLSGTKLGFEQVAGGGEIQLDLQNIKALSLSADFEPARVLMIDCSLQDSDDLADERLCVLDSSGNPLIGKHHGKGNILSIPIEMKDASFGFETPSKLGVFRKGGSSQEAVEIVTEVDIPLEELFDVATVAQQRQRILIKQLTFKRTSHLPAAFRVVVRSAEGLPGEGRRLPTAYCTVYLVNDKGDRLTVNSVDARTEVGPPTNDPTWEKEFLLRYDGQEVSHGHFSHNERPSEVPTGVMVKIRDSSSGILRHRHIGQVVVPINCFIYQTEATFTLPLDPTYRMTGAVAALGMVHLVTELVSINPETGAVVRDRTLKESPQDKNGTNKSKVNIEEPPASSAVITPPRLNRSNTFKKKDDDGPPASKIDSPGSPGRSGRGMQPTAQGKFCVSEERGLTVSFRPRRLSAWASWWPVRTLSNTAVDSRGHLCCKPRALCIRLVAGSAGALALCEEAKHMEVLLPHGSERITEVSVPWTQILSVIELSEAVLLITLIIKSLSSSPSEIAKQVMRYSDSQVDLLVAPCRATQMHLVINHRISSESLRTGLDSFIAATREKGFVLSAHREVGRKDDIHAHRSTTPRNMSHPTIAPSSPRLITRKVSGAGTSQSNPSSSNADVMNRSHGHIGGGAEFMSSEDMQSILKSFNRLMESLELTVHDNAPYALRLEQHQRSVNRQVVSTRSILKTINNCSSNSADYSSRPSREHLFDFGKVCLLLRSVAYCAVLRSVCRDIYTHSATVELKLPLSSIGGGSGASSSSSSHARLTVSSSKVLSILPVFSGDALRSQCNEQIACISSAIPVVSNDAWSIGPLSRRISELTATCACKLRELLMFAPFNCNQATSFSSNDSLASLRSLARDLIGLFHQAIRASYSSWTCSKEALGRLGSNSSRCELLSFLISKNHDFDDRVTLCMNAVSGFDFHTRAGPNASAWLLLTATEIQSLMDWYGSWVNAEANSQLNKVMQEQRKQAINRFGLPWDIRCEEGVVRSGFPEALNDSTASLLDKCCSVETEAAQQYASVRPNCEPPDGLGPMTPMRNIQKQAQAPQDRSPMKHTSHYPLIGGDVTSNTNQNAQGNVSRTRMIKRDCQLLSLNESIIGNVVPVYFRLANEYLRALQGKHWEQGDKVSSEMLANLQFLLSVANDAHRIVTTYIPLVFRRTSVLMSGDALAQSLLHEFGQVQEVACRQLSRCLFAGLTQHLIDFDAQWTGGGDVLKTITTALNYNLRDAGNAAEKAVLVRLRGLCADICAVRLLVMLRDRADGITGSAAGASSNANVKLTSFETERLVQDAAHVISVFQEGVGSRLFASPSRSGTPLDACLDKFFDQYDCSVRVRLNTAIAVMRDLKPLLTVSYESEAFSNVARAVVRRYRIASSNSLYANVASTFLTCIVSSRSDTCSALQTLVGVILENHGGRLSGVETQQSFRMGLAAGEGIANATYPGSRSNGSDLQFADDTVVEFSDDAVSRVFGSRQSQAALSPSAESDALSVSTPLKAKKPLLSTPFTLKQFREITTDALSNVLHRRPDTSHGELLRTLGLEDDIGIGAIGTTNGVDELLSISKSVSQMSFKESPDFMPAVLSPTAALVRNVSKLGFGLIVSDLQLRGLSSSSLFSSANPYIAVVAGDQRQKTSVHRNCSTCSWPGLRLQFQNVPPSCAFLVVQAFDKELVRRKRSLGSVVVSLLGLEAAPIDGWFALEGGDAGRGEVHLSISLA